MNYQVIRTIAKAALEGKNFGLSQALAKACPNDCTLMKAFAWAKSLPWRVDEHNGQWSLTYLVASIGAGVHRTIGGELVKVEPWQATGMWSGCSLMPHFASEGDARDWAVSNRLLVVV